MPPNNRLAPPLRNSLASYVPAPLEPGMLPQTPSGYGMQDRLTNLSIGMGRGLTDQLEGTKQLVTQPVATAQALIEAARQMGTDPRIVLDMLRAARQKAMSGALGLGELIGGNVPMGVRGAPVMREIDVYHGSPHRFEEFDASKIGTGEGAQVYGRGLYFAENPEVAMAYKKELEPGRGDRDEDVMARVLQSTQGDTAAAAAELRRRAEFSMIPEATVRFRNMADRLDAGFNPSGSFYTVDLPDEMVDRMLDWDKPFNKQSPQAQEAIKKALEIRKKQTGGYGLFDPLEKSSIKNLIKSIGEERLRQAGIPGVQYLDAGSRGGEGTRNFVVFPGEEKKTRILKRE